MTDWKQYRRKGFVEARPCDKGERVDTREVSVSSADLEAYFYPDPISPYHHFCTVDGGKVGHNPDNLKDQWYINPEYFKKNYEEV